MVQRQRDGGGDRRGQRPEDVVQECIALLQQRFAAAVESRALAQERVAFLLPHPLREFQKGKAPT